MNREAVLHTIEWFVGSALVSTRNTESIHVRVETIVGGDTERLLFGRREGWVISGIGTRTDVTLINGGIIDCG